MEQGIGLLLLVESFSDTFSLAALIFVPIAALGYVSAAAALLVAYLRRAFKERTKQSWLAVASIPSLLAALMFIAPALAIVIGAGHPSDAKLLAKFNANRIDLELLVDMFQHDKGLGRVGDRFTRPENPTAVGVTDQRIAEYRRLCGKIVAIDCIEGYDAAYERLYGEPRDFGEIKDPIWIHLSSLGLSISGSGKGYVYSRNPVFPLVEDLDHVRPSRSGTWLRHIEGSWYLYYDYED